jgi:drug/metabolite transporter (DMT)-like permease
VQANNTVRQKKMPPIFALTFPQLGDIRIGNEIALGLLAALIVSVSSLVMALRSRRRRKGRWHAWIALVCSAVFLQAASYLLTTMQRSANMANFWVYCLPAFPALLSFYLTGKKDA